MRRSGALLFLTAFLLVCAHPALAYNSEFVTGEDWSHRMSPREKFMSLVPPAILFSDYDVHLKLSLPQYIVLIDQVMERNPRLQSEEISNVFASTIYLLEPQNRPALDDMEARFLRGDFMPPSRPAHLDIDDLLEPINPAS